ncbi:putative RNA-dependent RNA polymerase 1 [Nosema granulosis]|uniref:RNA-dependent RNA polymerase 1 n=1 Tax=Nosema granulosis TaxID=83296 RepID=A0A9P6H2X8_9MICR|nr:putative RNA-dependent RNA polymerase 1 [Nosema granulosis]
MKNHRDRFYSNNNKNENPRTQRNNTGASFSGIVKNTKNNNVFLYNPDREVLKNGVISISGLLTKSERAINRLVIVLSSQTLSNADLYSTKVLEAAANNTVVKFVKFAELTNVYCEIVEEASKFRTALIFDDIQNLDDIKTISKNSHTFKEKFCYVLALTSSPTVFLEFKNSLENIFMAFFYNRKNYFKYFQTVFNESNLVVYKDIENELYLDKNSGETCIDSKFATLSRFINDLKMGNISDDMFCGAKESLKTLGVRLMYLLFNGVYDTDFILKFIVREQVYSFIKKHLEHLHHISDRLIRLKDILEMPQSNNVVIVFKKKGLIDIMSSMIQHYCPSSGVEKSNDSFVKILLLKNGSITRSITLVDHKEYVASNLLYDCTIFFDYIQSKIPKSTFILLTPSQKEQFTKQMESEKALEKKEVEEVISGTNPNVKPSKGDVKIKLHRKEQISNEDLISVCNENAFIIKDFNPTEKIVIVEKSHNLSYFGVKIANSLSCGVEVEGFRGYFEQFSIVGENVDFGVVTSFNTFSDVHSLDMKTFVFLKNGVIILYCMNDSTIFKIKINNSCIERHILVDKQELNVDIYICIGKRPKIYEANRTSTRLAKLKVNNRTRDRYDIFESLQWNRASLKEVPFIEHRSDVRVRINLKNNADQQKLRDVLASSSNYRGNKENGDLNKSRNNYTGYRKTKLYDIIDSLVSVFNRFNNGQVIFTKILGEQNNKLSTNTIYDYFKDIEFSEYYYLVCLLSQKGRFFHFNLDIEDCEIIKKNVKDTVMFLMAKINTRFLNIKMILQTSKPKKQAPSPQLMRHVIITPLSIFYKFPISFDKNRVLREFDHEKFLRVSLREEDKNSKVKDSTTKDQNMIYEYYRTILLDGLFIGERKYFFLAMTMSQMRLHSAWFITPYFCDNVLIGPDYIRTWLGNFSEIKNIGKYAMRLGQPLSSTYATVNMEKFLEAEDIERGKHVFSDGVGLISFSAARDISTILGLTYIPSAFQVRFAGFKGVVGVHPLVEEDAEYFKKRSRIFKINDTQNSSLCEDTSVNLFEEIRNKLIDNLYLKPTDQIKRKKNSIPNLIMRPSMKKFLSDHRNVEVVTHAVAQPCYLNRQYIMLLEGLGVDLNVFLQHHDDYLFNHLSDIYNNPNDYIKRHFGLFPLDFKIENSRIVKKLITAILNKHVGDFYKKNRILVRKGSVLMGVLDELAILGENEVFIKIKKDLIAKNEGFVVDGDYFVVTGPVAVMKNPCLHPGDIRTVMAVDKPELRYLQNVLVFNQKGSRPLPNMCSGSDLDGDMYTVLWDPSLLPRESFEPSEYQGSIVLNKEMVSSRDIVNFYIRYIRNYHLGGIAHAHLVYCDEKDIKHENSILLAELFNKSIDFPKTGFMATVPETLIPRRYPDFMESKINTYPSFKTVGILFRRGGEVNLNSNLKCECRSCLERAIRALPRNVRLVVEASAIKYKEVEHSTRNSNILSAYKSDIRGIMEKHGFKKEEMAFLNFSGEDEAQEEILVDLKGIFNKFRMMVRDRKADCQELLMQSEACGENINSLPLHFPIHKNESQKFIYSQKLIDKNLFNRISKDGRFILNSNVEIKIEGKGLDVEEIIGNKQAVLEAWVDENLYLEMLNIESLKDESFSEIFNLLFIGKFFTIESFDLVCLFFIHLFGKLKSSKNNFTNNSLEICRILQEISRDFYSKAATVPFCHFINREILGKNAVYSVKNQSKNTYNIKQKFEENPQRIKAIIDNLSRILSTVSMLVVLNINFLEKVLHVLNIKRVEDIKPRLSTDLRVKIESYSHLIINGMFDSSDELKLESYEGPKKDTHADRPLYQPILLNKGFCDQETYKDNLREFFINIFLGGIPETGNHLGIFFQVTATPGKFYLYNVDSSSVNTILTIDQLKAKTLFYKNENNDRTSLKSYFYNYSEIFYKDLRQGYIKSKGIVFHEKEYEYILSMFKENVRYQIYFDKKLSVSRISKNKKVKGKAYIIKESSNSNDQSTNCPKDIHFELSYEEIIFDGKSNCYDEVEKKMFSGNILSIKNDEYVLDSSLGDCRKFRFEINTTIAVKNGLPISLSNRQVLTPGRNPLVLDNKNTRLALYSTVTRIFEKKKELKLYIEDFETIWKCYTTYYC